MDFYFSLFLPFLIIPDAQLLTGLGLVKWGRYNMEYGQLPITYQGWPWICHFNNEDCNYVQYYSINTLQTDMAQQIHLRPCLLSSTPTCPQWDVTDKMVAEILIVRGEAR